MAIYLSIVVVISSSRVLGAGISPLLGPASAAYVLFLAVLGPVLARVSP
jgi:hypothetical protein